MKLMENEQTEFKQQFTSGIAKEVIAFANTDGGKIYVGLDDSGNIVHLENCDLTLQQITNTIKNCILPDIMIFVKCGIERIDDENIIVVKVFKGTNKPYHLKSHGLKEGGVFVRIGSSSLPATNEAITKMLREADDSIFEKMHSKIQELTFEYASAEFKKKGVEFSDSQRKSLGLVNYDNAYTNLGLLLSDQCEHTVKIAVFQGIQIGQFQDRFETFGSILKQLTESYEYINQHNKIKSIFVGLERIDKRDYPETAIRESLLNAIVHRSYSLSGSIQIKMFDNRLEITSIGGLVPGLSLNDIKKIFHRQEMINWLKYFTD